MKPNERARSLYNNALYFTKDRSMAIELCHFMIESFILYCRKMDDKVYWIEVKSEIEKI